MKRWLFASLLVLGVALVSHAQPVSGNYTYNFSGTNLPLYYFDGTFSTNVGGIDETFVLELTPQGRIRGNYFAHYNDGAVMIDLSGNVGGRLSSDLPFYHLLFSGHGPVQGTAYGRPVRGSHSFRVLADLNPTTGFMTGTERATACLVGYACKTVSEPISFEFIEAGNGEGNWSLTLNITNRNNRIIGSADATLTGSGPTLNFRVSGTYAPRRAVVKLQLRGRGDAVGVLLKLEANPAMEMHSIHGKLFGQQIEASGEDCR